MPRSVLSSSGYAFDPLSSGGTTPSWAPVRFATTGDVVDLAAGAPLQPDGFNVVAGDRILVQAQINQTQNGIYRVVVPGAGANGQWLRAADANTSAMFTDGKEVHVGEGTVYKDTEWYLTTDAAIVLGVSNIVFVVETDPVVVTGWTHDGGPPSTVRLTTATDQVAIGTATPVVGRKVTILTTGANQGIRVSTTATTDNVLEALNGAEAFPRMTLLTDSLSFSSGVAAVDTRAWRSGVSELTVDNGAVNGQSKLFVSGYETVTKDDAVLNANSDVLILVHTTTGLAAAGLATGILFRNEKADGTITDTASIRGLAENVGAGTERGALAFFTRTGGGVLTYRWLMSGAGDFVPQTDAALVVGTATSRLLNVSSNNFNVFAVSGDATPTAKLASQTLSLGISSADGLKVRLQTSVSKTLVIDDGSGGPLTNCSILGLTTTQGRSGATLTRVFANSGYVATATDETILWDPTGGNCTQVLPAAITGTTYTIKHFSASANTLTITPNGAETIDGLAPPVILTKWQAVHLRGVTGAGWAIV